MRLGGGSEFSNYRRFTVETTTEIRGDEVVRAAA
jgi:hypothetical protein